MQEQSLIKNTTGKKYKKMYIIIKEIESNKGTKLPVIMLNGHAEILEFEKEAEALNFADIMNTNTDSGHKYSVKKVGS